MEIDSSSTSGTPSGASLVHDPGRFEVQTETGTAGTNNVPDSPALNPFLHFQMDRSGELIADYRYRFTNSVPASSRPMIQLDAAGAITRHGQYQAGFKANLRDEDSIVMTMPDGKVLQGRVVAISVSDQQGNRLWLGQLKDCQGELLPEPGNQILYRDAFEGIRASVLYTCELNAFEQDIILHERPVLPPELDASTARIEVWSEFARVPEPRKTVGEVVLREAMDPLGRRTQFVTEDETLDFGSMRIVEGTAFRARPGAKGGLERERIGPVVKRWLREGDVGYLIESADLPSLSAALEPLQAFRAPPGALDLESSGGIQRLSARRQASLTVPGPSETERGGNSAILMAQVQAETGVILDYRIVTTSLLNINFGTVTYAGPAAAGKGSGDYWNSLATPGVSAPTTFNNLLWSEGSGHSSGIQAILENTPGVWGNATGNMMVDSYIYPQFSNANATVRLNNIPSGTYDFYIYGAWGGIGVVNGNYVLSVGGQSMGLKQTIPGSSWAALNWTENEHYVLYSNVSVGMGQQVEIIAMPGGNVALFNGLQMVAAGSANTPPTISNLPDQSTPLNTPKGPISFSIGDAQTPASSLSVWATSANPTVVPNANISLGGSGSSRTITLTPAANQTGSALITVTVSDGSAQTSDTFQLTVTATQDYVEISKAGMSADASTTGWDWVASNAIDGFTADPGWHNEEGRVPGTDWLRINLGTSKTVARVQYHPRQWAYNGTFLQYRIYVTDSSVLSTNAWGAPVSWGTWTWPAGAEIKTVDFTPKQGKYVIFYCDRGAGYDRYASCNEVWIYSPGGVANTPPTVSNIPDQSIAQNGSTGPLAFTIGDQETPLANVVLSRTTTNPTLIPLANITFGGSGANRTVSATAAAGQTGNSMVTVTVTDGSGASAQDSFLVTVTSPDTDGDGLPDAWEMAHFGTLSQGADGDPDRDGFTNLAEYNANTHPGIPDPEPPGGGPGLILFTPRR